MKEEIRSQIEDLPAFASELREDRGFRHLDPSRMIFTGSGDSFASSLFAHYLSGMQVFAADPFELQLYPKVTKNKTLFITSISGRTRTNIQLARAVKGLAKKRVAITANPESPLGKECDDIIRLRYRGTGILTSGTASFSASLLAVASLIRRLPRLDSLRAMERHAAEWAEALWSILPESSCSSGPGLATLLPCMQRSRSTRFWDCLLSTSIRSNLGIHSFSHYKRNQTILSSWIRARTRRRVEFCEFSRRMVSMHIL